MKLYEARLAHDPDPGRFIPDDTKARLFAAFRKQGVKVLDPAAYDFALRRMAATNCSPGTAARGAAYRNFPGVRHDRP